MAGPERLLIVSNTGRKVHRGWRAGGLIYRECDSRKAMRGGYAETDTPEARESYRRILCERCVPPRPSTP